MIHADAGIYIWLAALLLFLPFDWVVSAFTAALIHEICHIVTLLMLGGKIRKVRISVSGCVMEATSPGDFVSLCSILAGPAGSIALLLFCRMAPKIAVSGLFHGVYNLLPLMPLDGGRALLLILNRICPLYADIVFLWVGRFICVVVFSVAVWCTYALNCGVMPIYIAIFWIMKLLPRKIPCKPSGIGVQ